MSLTPAAIGNAAMRYGAIAMIAMAACYITLFILYGALISPPHNEGVHAVTEYLSEHLAIVKLSYIIGYMVFAVSLLIGVQVVHEQLRHLSTMMVNTATLFGLFWVVILFAAGMVGIVSLHLIDSLQANNPAAAETVYRASGLIEQGLGGGIEFVGGMWVLLLGIIGFQHGVYSKSFSVFSILKGLIGVATLFFAHSELRDMFGLTGIVWFFWFGIILWRKVPSHAKTTTA